MNPKGAQGQFLTCICCDSYLHLIANCPNGWESVNIENLTNDKEVNIVLCTGGIKSKLNQLGRDAFKRAVLDCAYSTSLWQELNLNWLSWV